MMEQKSLLYFVTLALRPLLYPFTLAYGALVWLRNKLYDVGFFDSIQFSLPVICVGNLSTGGTGKTPHIEYLIRLLQYRFQVATMSRGYKRYSKGFVLAEAGTNALRIGDEPMQFFLKFPEAVVCVAEERLTGIPHLLQRRPNIEVILLDDAYQHRSVKAGLNILIFDFNHPFYKDHVLPFGNLREGRSAYKRADIIVVSKCPLSLTQGQAEEMKRCIAPTRDQEVFFSGIRYGQPYDLFSKETASVTQKNAILVCGIAKPAPLIAYLEADAQAVHTLGYADHHYFVNSDLEEIRQAYDNWTADNKVIVTTEKDATRLLLHVETLMNWSIPIIVVPIEIVILLEMGDTFDAKVMQHVEHIIQSNLPPEIADSEDDSAHFTA